jgi:hypothetical protein
MHKVAAIYAAQAGRRGQQARTLDRNGSRSSMEGEGGSPQRVRVRVYGFGQHLGARAGTGSLVQVPNSEETDMHVVKGILLRSVFANGDEALLSGIDWTTIQLFLLPDGEEILSAGEIPPFIGRGLRVGWRGVPFEAAVSDAPRS